MSTCHLLLPFDHCLCLVRTGVLCAGLGALTALAQNAPIREKPEALAAERAKVQAQFPEAFAPVTDDPALPRVLLIGDSISIGYTPPVRALLRGIANVHRVPENGGPSNRGLQQLDFWLGSKPWAVIHFNFGLHDLALVNAGRPRNPVADYERNLRALVARLQATGARLVFATSTPVPARLIGGGPKRHAADVPVYNAVALRVMAECHIPVDDLYAVALPRLAEIQQHENVHYTAEGYKVLAQPVAAAIRAQLAAAASSPRK